MNLSILLAQQIVVIGIMILFGYVAGKTKLVTLENSSHISRAILYIVGPCMLIDALQTDFTRDKAIGFAIAVVAGIIIHAILLAISYLVRPIFKFNNVEQASIIYTNCGNLLVPIIGYMLNKEYVLYCCAFICTQTILVWTHCIFLLGGKQYMSAKKILLNPNILAVALGLILFFARIRIPEIPLAAISRTGDCVGPMSMVVVGVMIASANLKEIFLRPKSWVVTLLRLIICPLIVIAVMYVTHATRITPDAGKVLFISFLAAAAPTASNVSQIANVVHKDEILAGSINIMTVLLCMITMPLMTILYQTLCL